MKVKREMYKAFQSVRHTVNAPKISYHRGKCGKKRGQAGWQAWGWINIMEGDGQLCRV